MINHTTAPVLNQLLYPHKDRSDNKIAEHTSKGLSGSLSSETSQKVLNEKLVKAIDKVLQKNRAAPARTLDAQDFAPKAVADRILNYIQDAISRVEARGGNSTELMNQARQGVSQGFKDAKNILTSLNALSGTIAKNIQKTFDLIHGGLDKISHEKPAPVQHNTTQHVVKQSSSQSLSLDIKTADGDTVTLKLQKNQSTNAYQAQIQNGQNSTTINEFSFDDSSSFSFAVQGVLDAGESEAIKELLSNVKDVATEFFNSNASAAYEAGLSLGYDSRELTRFSLSLNENQSVTQAYREVSGYSDAMDQTRPSVNLENLLKPIHDFAKSLETTLFNTENTKSFTSDAVENTFNFFSQIEKSHKDVIQQLESLSGKPFESVTHDIISQIKS